MSSRVLAVDLGATSGRVIEASIGPNHLDYSVVHRFPNGPHVMSDGLHWNVTALFAEVLTGLSLAASSGGGIASIGVDSWAVDYGLLQNGQLLVEPFHYRDERTQYGVERVHGAMPFDELFVENGLQFMPINTLYQLAAEDWPGQSGSADALLMIPDLINYWLTGESFTEITNASTTGLLDIATGDFSPAIIDLTGAKPEIFAPLIEPGHVVGNLLAERSEALGFRAPVIAVGSHDTASAVVAAPLASASSAYISCGTWGLVGVEVSKPILSEAARAANFTNERGVDGRIRFLHNVMGLWLLNESVSHWNKLGDTRGVEELVLAASSYSHAVPVFDVADPVFMAPGDMPSRIANWFSERGLAHGPDTVFVVASIMESLARAMAETVHTAGLLSGTDVREICIVGGGSAIPSLCQKISNAAGVPVVAGPVEATALGNILVQARTIGLIDGDLGSLRALVRRTADLVIYQPHIDRKNFYG